MTYPQTRRDDVVETLHGTPVPDPYRWLEDAESPEVAAWVKAQGDYAEQALAEVPEREWFRGVLRDIVARPRSGVPVELHGRWLVDRNDGTQAQDVWYMASTLEDLLAGGDVVVNPNEWSTDGTSSLNRLTVSRDGRLMAIARSDAGSDWQHVRVRDLDTGELLPDEVTAKFSGATWLPDHASFLYTTFAEHGATDGAATQGVRHPRLMIHRLGSDDDELLLTFPDEPHTYSYGWVSHDGRWLVVHIYRGTENVNRLWVYPLAVRDGRTHIGEPITVDDQAAAEFSAVRVWDDPEAGPRLFLHTDLDAPLGRVVTVDLTRATQGDVEFVEVVAESDATLESVTTLGDRLLLGYLADADSQVAVCNLDGTGRQILDLPSGALLFMSGTPTSAIATVGFSTISSRTVGYAIRWDDAATAPRVEPLALLPDADPVAPPHRIERIHATSADGTRVPAFLIRPEGQPSGPRPTLLYGYGGFKIPVQADFRPGWAAWLRAGGTLVIANLRGGGEYGTAWYDDGRLANKQHVFDDAIAVAEHLVSEGLTTPSQLAVHGRSNGGLLVGALMTQRPDLFGAALPTVGVLDLLRFHLFTGGAAWISDYGDPDTPEGFADAIAYSPLHNVVDATAYPPTLVCTADHDDRVVPLHSFKFAAALQHAQAGDAPILLRVERAAGHGAGKSLQMVADEWADILSFAAHHTGLGPRRA